jgi:hypothetical protein
MNRSFLALSFACSSFVGIKAQDTLILRDGTEKYVKVTEVDESTVSFRKAGFSDGPVYRTPVSSVMVIIYKGGKRDLFPDAVRGNDHPDPPPAEGQNRSVKTALTVGDTKLILSSSEIIPDKKDRYDFIRNTITIQDHGHQIMSLVLEVTQRRDFRTELDEDHYNQWCANSSARFGVIEPNVNEILEAKYESPAGRGFCWGLPADFFTRFGTPSYVGFVDYIGKVKDASINKVELFRPKLMDTRTLETKILSIGLIWYQLNFYHLEPRDLPQAAPGSSYH